MAGKGATLAIRIVSDASGASKGFEEAESRVAGFQRGLDKASVAAGGVLAGVGALAKGAYDAASRLQQSTGAIDSVFGDWALDIEQAAQKASQAVGLSTSAYEESASIIGAQLKSMGFPIADNVKSTQELIGVGADLAATFGGSTEDAVSALSSALKGERDPIERYGITLSQAAVDAKVAALGLDTSTDAAKRNSQAQATLALITDQSAGALGAFGRESDTAAGQSARATAEWENAQAALGEVLLPIVTQAAEKFGELAKWLVANKDTVIPLIGVIAGLAAVVIGVNGALRAYYAVQMLVNLAMMASPVVWIAAAILAIGAAIYIAYQKSETFRNIVDAVGRALRSAFDGAKSAIQWVIDKLSVVKDAAGWVGGLFSAPMALTVRPEAGGAAVAGLYGAAAGASVPGLYGAAMSTSAGGGSTAGRGSPAANVTNVTVNVTGQIVDPVALGRTLTGVLQQYARASGTQLTVAMGGRA